MTNFEKWLDELTLDEVEREDLEFKDLASDVYREFVETCDCDDCPMKGCCDHDKRDSCYEEFLTWGKQEAQDDCE